jgi:23S rRNA (adenine2503-C2)-methyltransferase
MKQSLYGYTLEGLQNLVLNLGYKKYNAEQILRWLYQSQVTTIDEMTNLSLTIRESLKEKYEIYLPEIIKKQVSQDGTIKFLLKLKDGNLVETVLMRYTYGNAVCVSSQVGCNMGCSFCASGLLKKVRDLTPSEMVAEVMTVQLDLNKSNERVSHVVIMGIGEPFDNYNNVMQFIYCINEAKGLAIGARHISVSTSGLVPKIRQLSNEKIQINLAISLHAPNNEIRSKIMPINNRFSIEEVLKACQEYQGNDGSRYITFEYLLLDGINDSIEHAKELVALMKKYKLRASFNLIPFNPWPGCGFKPSEAKNIKL